MNLPKELEAAFSAGAFGGLVSAIAFWLAGRLGLLAALGVKLAPGLSPAGLYPRIVWGGLWAFLFLLGWPRGGAWKRGLVLGLVPALFQLLYVYPVRMGRGILGLELGLPTPVVIVAVNMVWGLAVAAWFRLAGQSA